MHAADAQVAAEVGRARAVRRQQGHGEVGGEPLGAAAEVELDAGRPDDGAGRVVDVHAPPVGAR